jgi:hypothetical protein
VGNKIPFPTGPVGLWTPQHYSYGIRTCTYIIVILDCAVTQFQEPNNDSGDVRAVVEASTSGTSSTSDLFVIKSTLHGLLEVDIRLGHNTIMRSQHMVFL